MEYYFDHERLDVYRVALQFITWVTQLMDEYRPGGGPRVRETFDHLDRASLSILFNTAEGNSKRQMKTRARFFDDARGSSGECAACLDALVAKGVCAEERIREGKGLLSRIAAMLTKLVNRFSDPKMVKEDGVAYFATDEDDGEDEDDRSTEIRA